MFTSSPPLTLTPPLTTIAKPLLPSLSVSPRSRRKMSITASVSTFLEPIPINSRKSLSLYDILRVKQTASSTEIKTAYRSLAKLYHPDTAIINDENVRSDGRDFMEIHDAYETLSDPAARAVYDLSLGVACRRRKDVVGVGFNNGYYPTRRWETDQCW